MSAQPEVWRVSTPEGIFETDLETLKQWILEGCVLPTDKVCKGTLSWIEAGRVPKLKGAFNGEVTPVVEPVTNSDEPLAKTWVEPATVPSSTSATACRNHPEAEPDYACRNCGALTCRACTKLVSGKVPVCSLCGDLCRDYRAVTERATRAQFQSSGFGMEDFVRAIRYPLQHKAALFSGAVLYGLLLLAGFRGSLLAWLIMFGCISHVISQVAWGRFHRSFMPDFSSFSLLDDVVGPVFLGLGIMIVSWGPVIALVLALMFGVLSGNGPSSIAAGSHAEEAISDEDLAVLTDPEADPVKQGEANKKLQQLHPAAGMAREAEESKAEASDPLGLYNDMMPYLGGGGIVLLLLLFIGWGVFYYPMALAVAGYTQSFGSVLNPLVGLDTIRRMGTTYFKAFAMVIVVQVVAFVFGVIVSFVTAPFALPYTGNVVGNLINAPFTFYFNLVIACLLGLSLFKCADRLGISVD